MAIVFEKEKDLEDFLMDNQEFLGRQFGLENHTFYRQVNLGTYGVADIVGVLSDRWPDGTPYCDIHIFELKNEPLTHPALSQIARYREFFMRFEDRFADFTVRGSLIGPKTFPTKDDLCFLAQSIDWLGVYEFTFHPTNGLRFGLVADWKFSQDNASAMERAWELLNPGEQDLLVIPSAANESAH
jgi:hypothetical protein